MRGVIAILFLSGQVYAQQWMETFGTADDDFATSSALAADGNHMYVGGYKTDPTGWHPWIIRINADGSNDTQWLFTCGSGNALINDMVAMPDGGVLVVGFGMPCGGTGTGWNGLAARLSSTGTIMWQKVLSSTGVTVAQAATRTFDGNFVVAGNYYESSATQEAFAVKLSGSTGALLAHKRIPGSSANDEIRSVIETTELGQHYYLLAGGYGHITGSAFNADMWVVKLGATLGVVWDQLYSIGDSEILSSIRELPAGGYVAAGYTAVPGPPGGVVLTLDRTGKLINSPWGYPADLRSVRTIPGGGFLIGGYRSGGGTTDGWMAKLNADGTIASQYRYSGGIDDYIGSVQVVGGSFFAAGYTRSFGGGNQDFLLVRTDFNCYIGGSCPYVFLTTDAMSILSATLTSTHATAMLTSLTMNTSTLVQLNVPMTPRGGVCGVPQDP